MSLYVTDEIFNQIVRHAWEDIACFAYSSFVKNGRGVVKIRKIIDAETIEEMEFKMAYTAYEDMAAATETDAAELMREYDPEKELVAQYQRSADDLHTTLVKTPPDQNQPRMFDLFKGFSFEDISNEFATTYSPESVYDRAQKMAKD